MFKNKKEHFIFILMICTTMVFIMSCYNIAIIEGFSLSIFKHAIMGFPLAFVYALIGDIFIVGKIVKLISSKILNPNDSIAKVGLCMSFFTGCGMVIWMSLFGVVTNIGLSSNFVYAYIIAMFTNFIFAIPLNLLIVSPLMRFLFFKLFPPIGHIDNQRKAV
ncbi:DUF2798 domain-containing protein [Paraclostridium bifermentans]|uniref:DUF2798 domain-containing protein n=1 Tax=Paraclostridium bifermentans TaxID=1490 RepID=UPI001FF4A16E|nr:DUF2798 domain-containing protein [Paraclostridium bifermentans]UOW67882.1 DUF2798 domain-containing protein [Paraclostridium bifermentans]